WLQHDLALEQVRLAGRALPLAAAVNEVEPVPERRVEDRLLLVAVDLLADRLEDDPGTHLAGDLLLLRGATISVCPRRRRGKAAVDVAVGCHESRRGAVRQPHLLGDRDVCALD